MRTAAQALLYSMQEADPNYGAYTLEPIRPHENVLGTLSDESRRIHAVLTLQFEQFGAYMKKMAEIERDPSLQTEKIMDRWVTENKILRTKISICQALLKLSLFNDVPEAMLHQFCFLRAGFTVVSSDRPPEDDAVEKATNVILSNTFEGPPS